MPTYVYKFTATGETIEVYQAFTDDALTDAVHPGTGRKMRVRKVFTPVGVTFKGGGFYKTDSRNGTSKKSGSSSSNGDGGTSDSSSSTSEGAGSTTSSGDGGSSSSTDSSSTTSTAKPKDSASTTTPAKPSGGGATSSASGSGSPSS